MASMWHVRWSGPKAPASPCSQATCRLVESPPSRVLLLIAYPDIFQCADHVPDVLAHKPIGLEGIDDLLVEYTRRRGINSEGLGAVARGRRLAAGGIRRRHHGGGRSPGAPA